MQSRVFFFGIGAFAVGVFARTVHVIALPVSILLFIAGSILIAIWYIAKQRLTVEIGALLLLVALGITRTAFVQVAPPAVFEPLFNTDITRTGTIVTDPDVREANQRVTVEIQQGSVHMRLIAVAPLYPELAYGEDVTVKGTLEAPQPFETDGGRQFAYDHFLAKDGIFGIVNDAEVDVTKPPRGMFVAVQGALYGIKHVFEHSLSLALPEPYDGLATGILAGGKQGLGKELQDVFAVAGLLPIIVLSGYNVMIVAESILKSLSFLPKRFALTLAGLSVAAFVMAAGGGSSAIRAGLMTGLALFARATGRTYDVLRALAFVAFAMLLMNPLLLVYDPGFQFSFMATLGLILGTPIVERRVLWIRNAFMREITSTTIAAQLAVLPILLYQTGNLSLVSVPANILILPVVPLTMLLSFITGMISFIVPAFAALVGLPAYVFLWYIIYIATVAADLPLAQVILPAFSFVFVLASYGVLAYVVVKAKQEEGTPKGVPSSIAPTR